MKQSYQGELTFAQSLAREAGALILQHFSKTTKMVKSDTSPLTEADLAISRLINEKISMTYPQHAIIDEETEAQYDHGKEFVWICDPIDGTIPFSHHIPTSMFSLALVRGEKPVVGVAYDPYMDRMYSAVEGGGAQCNGESLHVGTGTLSAGETLFVIPYWMSAPKVGWSTPFDFNAFFELCYTRDLIISSIESFVYLSMLVAQGVVPAAALPAAKPWDRAASTLIVSEAGGVITDENGDPFTIYGKHKLAILGNRETHADLFSMVKQCLR